MGPLQGIKVIELATWIAAPRCARHLADMGADVIKVEQPQRGDPVRGLRMFPELPATNYNWSFLPDNMNKKSLAIDLNREEGRSILYELVRNADVVVSNYLPQIQSRLEVGYEHLSTINPRIIYVQASAWGSKGAEKDNDGFDIMALARTGITRAMGENECRRPSTVPAMGDAVMALWLAYGVMLALYHRERTGEGQNVHVSLLGSLMDIGNKAIQAVLATQIDIPTLPRETAANPLWNYYQTRDGQWVMLAMGHSDFYWSDFCQALSLNELEQDPKFNCTQNRECNSEALISIVDERFAAMTLEGWKNACQGRNILWGPVNTFEQAIADPQVRENDYVVKFDHPSAGTIDVMGIPIHLSKTPGELKTAPPELGQNTEEILLAMGYDWDSISGFKNRAVI